MLTWLFTNHLDHHHYHCQHPHQMRERQHHSSCPVSSWEQTTVHHQPCPALVFCCETTVVMITLGLPFAPLASLGRGHSAWNYISYLYILIRRCTYLYLWYVDVDILILSLSITKICLNESRRDHDRREGIMSKVMKDVKTLKTELFSETNLVNRVDMF